MPVLLTGIEKRRQLADRVAGCLSNAPRPVTDNDVEAVRKRIREGEWGRAIRVICSIASDDLRRPKHLYAAARGRAIHELCRFAAAERMETKLFRALIDNAAHCIDCTAELACARNVQTLLSGKARATQGQVDKLLTLATQWMRRNIWEAVLATGYLPSPRALEALLNSSVGLNATWDVAVRVLREQCEARRLRTRLEGVRPPVAVAVRPRQGL
jgi:hypothetical protein